MSQRTLDRGTICGILLSLSGISAGLWLDGGSFRQILQPSAAAIVLGGTLGAVCVQFPWSTIRQAIAEIIHLLLHPSPLSEEFLEKIVGIGQQVRKRGPLALDSQLPQIDDPFLRKSLTLVVDSVSLTDLRATLEVDMDLAEEHEAGFVAVLNAAGGFAPTFGIIGAVLGLIQVMQHMENIGAIGKGIAIAFVSTLYGIGSANLIFLPLAGKLKIRMREYQLRRELILEAVVAIVEGISVRLLRERLQSYLITSSTPAKAEQLGELVTQ